MLCSLHIGTVHLQFLNQMQSVLVFRLATLTMSHLYITLVGCKLLVFFASSFGYFVMERNVFFMIKNVLEPLL